MPALSCNLFFGSDLLLFSSVQVFQILSSLSNNNGKPLLFSSLPGHHLFTKQLWEKCGPTRPGTYIVIGIP